MSSTATDAPAAATTGSVDVEAVLRAAVVRVLEVDPGVLELDTTFGADLQVDSLAMVEILEAAEHALRPYARGAFRFDDELAGAWVTLGDAVRDATARL